MILYMVRFLTAGEAHVRALVLILERIPAGLPRYCAGRRVLPCFARF
jgi:chorismate synthase